MPGSYIRDVVNLLIYGGAFIGLCASCMTALTFELLGDAQIHQTYILLIGVATAALYCAHRVIGLHKLAHVTTTERFAVIRRYKPHIWLYCFVWVLLSVWYFIPFAGIDFVLWLIPGGSIAIAYVFPLLSKGRRLRDLGWIKIIIIGWSWAWLTAFLPAYYFSNEPLYLSALIGMERLLFIIVITIPFEIRDMGIDRSVGLLTLPSRFGISRTMLVSRLLCGIIILLSMFIGFHYLNISYIIAMALTVLFTLWILKKSIRVSDDYFFSGLTDGLMIMALVIFWVIR